MGNSSIKKEKFWSGGILYNPETNEILLQKRDINAPVNPGLWGFFGGACERGETPEGCLIREWKEELGINASKEQLIPLCDYLNVKRNIWRFVFYMKSDFKKSEMKLGEGEDFDWVLLNKILGYNLTDKTANTIIAIKKTRKIIILFRFLQRNPGEIFNTRTGFARLVKFPAEAFSFGPPKTLHPKPDAD